MKTETPEIVNRDWFAVMALPNIIAYSLGASMEEMNRWAKDSNAPEGTTVSDLVAMAAYNYADSMMKMREK